MTTLITVTVVYWTLGYAGTWTFGFSHPALCQMWVESNATALHRAVVVEDCQE